MKNLIVKITCITVAILLLAFIGKRSYCSLQPTDHSIDTLRCKKVVDFALEVAAEKELRMRIKETDPQFFFYLIPTKSELLDDSKRIISRKIVSLDADTIYDFHFNKFNYRPVFKLFQYTYKNKKPLNIMSFSHFFNDCIKSNGLSVEKWYIEFIDLTNNSIISKDGNYIERNSNNCIKSNLLILDIYNTIGIKACVEATNI